MGEWWIVAAELLCSLAKLGFSARCQLQNRKFEADKMLWRWFSWEFQVGWNIFLRSLQLIWGRSVEKCTIGMKGSVLIWRQDFQFDLRNVKITIMKTNYIRGTFSPALDGDCSWTLLDPQNNIIGSGVVLDSQRTTLEVVLPAGVADNCTLRVGPCQLAKRIDQSGGIVIVDTVMIHEVATQTQTRKASLTTEGKRV